MHDISCVTWIVWFQMGIQLPAWPGAWVFWKNMRKERLVLQTCVVPDEICDKQELYYRSSESLHINCGNVYLKAGQGLSSDTYMNILDVATWGKYTEVAEMIFFCQIRGKGKILIVHEKENEKTIVNEVAYGEDSKTDGCRGKQREDILLRIKTSQIKEGKIFFTIKTVEKSVLYHAEYRTEQKARKEIFLSLIICTFKRKEYIERNVSRIRASQFFMEECKGHMFVRIIDNAKELMDTYGSGIKVYGNENTGGSGGFTKGMEETVKEKKQYPTTHVILMDDDVELQTESFIRLYAFLSYLRKEYEKEQVAGRMFRLDQREVQYTAAEIWNRGDIRHIGWNLDMTKKENLLYMNRNDGAEYGGWWFACYPIEFVENNRPIPFFLHCDDVEYGLRHGGTPLVLNGIQVWHETYEYRKSPMMAYYDMRNRMFVNQLFGFAPKKKELYMLWKKEITEKHVHKDFRTEYMMICAMGDYCKGIKWLYKIKPQKNHLKKVKGKTNRWKNAVLWRWTSFYYHTIYKHNAEEG